MKSMLTRVSDFHALPMNYRTLLGFALALALSLAKVDWRITGTALG
jgi:hypothetical protein